MACMELTRLHRCVLFALALAAGLGAEPGFCQRAGPDSRTVAAPKWLQPPALSGRCTDDGYTHAGTLQLLTAGGRSGATLRILHSGLDAYFCASGLPGSAGASLTIVVNETPRATSAPSIYAFAVSQA